MTFVDKALYLEPRMPFTSTIMLLIVLMWNGNSNLNHFTYFGKVTLIIIKYNH